MLVDTHNRTMGRFWANVGIFIILYPPAMPHNNKRIFCADKDAENMLGMLGANIVDTDIYHDEDDCPFKDEDTYMNNQVAESEDNEITSVETDMKISM